jgi:acyl-CoA dehydrogenase
MSGPSLLAGVVADLFAERVTPEALGAAEAGADTRPLWRELEELGLTLPATSEELGGSGGTLDDAATILRAAGRYAVPLPLAETGLLAGWLLERAGLHVPTGPLTVAPVRAAERLELRSGASGARTVHGRATRVPWAARADALVVLAEDGAGTTLVALVPASACRIEPRRNLAGEPRDDVVLDGVPVDPGTSAWVQDGRPAVRLRGALARSVMTLGALESARDHGLSHATAREQFGRPIARFQAVQDLLAVSARDTALARVAVELAVDAARRAGGEASLLETAVAKVVCARAAGSVARSVHQVHGAIGITKEHPLQFVTRRLWAWRDDFGTDTEWARELGHHALAAGSSLWAVVSDPLPALPGDRPPS